MCCAMLKVEALINGARTTQGKRRDGVVGSILPFWLAEGWVRFPARRLKWVAASGCSSVGRVPGLEPGCRRFESFRPDQNAEQVKQGVHATPIAHIVRVTPNHSTLSSTLLRGMPARLKMAKLVIPSSMRGCSRTLKRRKDTRGGLTSQSGDESGAISGDN